MAVVVGHQKGGRHRGGGIGGREGYSGEGGRGGGLERVAVGADHEPQGDIEGRGVVQMTAGVPEQRFLVEPGGK